MTSNSTQLKLKLAAAAVAGAVTLMPLLSHAADTMDKTAKPAATEKASMPATPADAMAFSDREQLKPWVNQKDSLKAMLTAGQDKAFYSKTLTDNGFQITSVNADKPEYVEYEIVKGGHSYEVQIDFDKTAKASRVDIESNLWRADTTKAAVRGDRVERATKYAAANERFSDRGHMKAWTSEKEQLEKALKPGQDKAAYVSRLKSLGYDITSTNENKKDYVEYEVVKGSNSYEVQIDLEAGKGKKIDVTSNMWQSDATEKAISQAKS